MNNNNHIAEVVFELAEKTFEKSKSQYSTYRNHYHDAFFETLQQNGRCEASWTFKKTPIYLFSNSQHEEMVSETCWLS